ncbi:MAG: TetR/AcrR family transcriptional regulator [Clostridiales bacterium]|nr:TetR/AcrR family transcriptional regulator [Clostridiales bacterium]
MNDAQPPKPLDRRQRKTRQAIQNALLTLMREKPLNKITVSELAATADVNRKTFYNHYSNIQEVRDELDQEYIDRLFSLLKTAHEMEQPPALDVLIESLVNALTENPTRTRLLFESGEHLYLIERLKELTTPYLNQRATTPQRAASLPYVLDYVTYGMMALLNTWIHAENPLSPQELSRLLTMLLQSNASADTADSQED